MATNWKQFGLVIRGTRAGSDPDSEGEVRSQQVRRSKRWRSLRNGFNSRGGSIKLKFLVPVIPAVAAVAAGAAYYHFVYAPANSAPQEVAYVLSRAATLVDTPAEIRVNVGEVKNGQRVEVVHRTRNWAHIRLADGKIGWIESKDLLDSQTYERGRQLLKEIESGQAQAEGHTTNEANLRLEPSREAPQLALLEPKEKVEVFGRRLVERAPADSLANAPAEPAEETSSGAPIRDAWYLIRAGSHGGWLLGRFITLDVPSDIEVYAQGINMVAWLVLNTVDDNGRKVPEYLVADRIGTQIYDFNHIRVFTWWVKNQHYVTAYVGSNLNGYLPIRISRIGDQPQFRLRMVDEKGRKYQKVYGMFNTVIRSLGTVDGWESNTKPARPVARPKRRR